MISDALLKANEPEFRTRDSGYYLQPATIEGTSGPMATILIVDDRPTNREVLVVLLAYRGHRLLEATDGAEALALVHSSRPDLAIVDILMPTMDGLEFVRQLREDATIAQTRVIFYTPHYLDQEASALASTCGVSAVLTKPCEPEEVLSTVDVVLGITPLVPTRPPAADFRAEWDSVRDG